MKGNSNVKIGTKVIIGFIICSVALAVVSVLSSITFDKMSAENKAMYEKETEPLVQLADMSQLYQRSRVIIRDIILNDDQQTKIDETDNLQTKVDGIAALIDQTKTVLTGENLTLLQSIETGLADYKNYMNQAAELALTDSAGAYALLESEAVDNAAMAVQDGISNLEVKLSEDAKARYEAGITYTNMIKNIYFIVVIASVSIALIVGIVIARSIKKKMNDLSRAAERLAAGDMEVNLETASKDEVGLLSNSIAVMVKAIRELIADANMLAQAAVAGEFNTRANTDKHNGDYKKIVEGVNATLDVVVDKVFWYESLLDSIPFPISVTDLDMNWTFINKPVENMLNVKRKDMLGKQCSNWNAAICGKEDCGVAGLRKGKAQTQFEQEKMNFQVDASFIYNLKGEKVGHIEVVQDITAKSHSAEYSAKEVERLAKNLKLLKEGQLKLEFNVDPGDEYTQTERKNFEEINNNFRGATETVAGYINELTYILGRFADGDLTEGIDSEYKGDFAELKEAINKIVDNLNKIFVEINTAADQVSLGAQQVSNGNQAISQGATEQASSIEELSATVAGIEIQTKENAENSRRSNEMAAAAKNAAALGNEQMKEMLKSMEDINESSESISKIIKVIDDIAFQTNMLALNAAVEAARAGVHGKGFAVVAEEVRNLAARSAKAANETAELIEGSMKKVGAGTKIANETAEALTQIVMSVEKTVQLGEKIAVASGEQAAGIGQVNQGIEQMSQVVQTNSATSEEGAAASEELSGQAELLKDKIRMFRLKTESLKVSAKAGKKQLTESYLAHDELDFPDNGNKY